MAEEPAAKIYPWHAKTSNECFSELGLKDDHLTTGLTTDEANVRLQKYGENKLSEKEKVTIWQRIYNQVANVLVGILVFVALVSAIRAATIETTDGKITNTIQVVLIVFVIT